MDWDDELIDDSELYVRLDLEKHASSTDSRSPIEIEIDHNGNARRPRPASPLIPWADGKNNYPSPTMSDLSVIPPDSFLDDAGSRPATPFEMPEAESLPGLPPSTLPESNREREPRTGRQESQWARTKSQKSSS